VFAFEDHGVFEPLPFAIWRLRRLSRDCPPFSHSVELGFLWPAWRLDAARHIAVPSEQTRTPVTPLQFGRLDLGMPSVFANGYNALLEDRLVLDHAPSRPNLVAVEPSPRLCRCQPRANPLFLDRIAFPAQSSIRRDTQVFWAMLTWMKSKNTPSLTVSLSGIAVT